jgi:pimeloyl-ACP methyl ester carboxylesterase
MWDDQFAAFAEHYRVIRYDFRGYGRSGRPSGPYSDVDDLRALLHFLKVDKAHLIGSSMGGNVAISFAITQPHMTTALIPVASGLVGYTSYSPLAARLATQIDEAARSGDSMTAVELALRMWIDGPSRPNTAVNSSVRMRIHRMMSDNFHTFIAPDLSQPIQPPPIDRLREITAPTMVIVGDKDMPDILAIADVIMERIPSNVEKLVLPDTAHMLNMEKPVEFNQVVLTFLHDRC